MRRDLHGVAVQPSADGSGLVPVDGFLENAMAPRPSFNDKSERGTFLAVHTTHELARKYELFRMEKIALKR